ncbi:unnamed protein product [Euphydryas editha]|uniref:Uncharacterized protein n=1 Tax=Euphydryas editha TaxID=104508 RepID=A0AAU9TXE4_EUPED|nr:unnamed protein product [Euphydryas editha]
MLTLAVTSLLSMYISAVRNANVEIPDGSEYPRLIADTTALVFEVAMTVVFIVALHLKHVLLMKIYLYFEIVFSLIGFVYSLAFLTKETASELFLILFQLMVQIYLVILIWSTIVKMQRDGVVKYTREQGTV